MKGPFASSTLAGNRHHQQRMAKLVSIVTKIRLRFVVASITGLAALVMATNVNLTVLRDSPTTPQRFTLDISGDRFILEELDVGTLFDCVRGEAVGIVLKDSSGVTRWSFNVEVAASYLADHGCTGFGTSAASIAGVATPTAQTAVWAVQVLMCGASCAGYDVHIFIFTPSFGGTDPKTGRYRAAVSEEIHQVVGLGALKFAFPRLVFYINNGYKECPSHWTRMIYEWMEVSPAAIRFVPTHTVSYESRQCVFSHTRWPPDPGD